MTREEAINTLTNTAFLLLEHEKQFWEAYEIAIKALEQPEVIRCKDCKWKYQHNCTRAVEVFIDDNKYCAWAERR